MNFSPIAGISFMFLGFMFLWYHLSANDPNEAIQTFFATIIFVAIGLGFAVVGR